MENCFNDIDKEISVASCSMEAHALMKKGIQFLASFNTADNSYSPAVNREYSIGSSLHRGYHHPSPIYDIIVGNTKRGRISKNPQAAHITHCHYYNQVHELFRIDTIYQNKVSYTEWIQKNDDGIYGFTVDCNGKLAAICKEHYEEGRIISYTQVHCVYISNVYECFDYLNELYEYDAEGLHRCSFIKFAPRSAYLIHKVYEFERKDGYLISYTECIDTNDAKKNCYRISKKIKA